MPRVGQLVIRRLDFYFIKRRRFIINGHVKTVGIIILIGYPRNFPENLPVDFHEPPRKTLRRSRQKRKIQPAFFGLVVHPFSHVRNDFKPEPPRLLRFAVVRAQHSRQALRKADKSDAKRSVL